MIFIISWAGQHENACFIAKQMKSSGIEACIVYSDPDPSYVIPTDSPVIRRPNELFWADKFKACLDAVGDAGMLVIHADCQCNDWSKLVERCKHVVEMYKDIGVWAPKINGTYWHVSVTQIVKLKNTELVLSALTDGIVFYLAPVVIDRMRKVDYETSKYGWGIDFMYCSHAHTIQKLVVIDLNVEVDHPRGDTGYNIEKAQSEVNMYLTKLTIHERIKYELLISHVKYNYVKRTQFKKN